MFAEDMNKIAKSNTNYRQVLMTGENAQVVAMSLPAGGDIGRETHPYTDQIFVVVEGNGRASVGKETRAIEAGDMVFVPAGNAHNVTSSPHHSLKLITIYSPPHHSDDTVNATKEEAMASEAQALPTVPADPA